MNATVKTTNSTVGSPSAPKVRRDWSPTRHTGDPESIAASEIGEAGHAHISPPPMLSPM